jgi:isopenicillin N synthase-like dioxygenase
MNDRNNMSNGQETLPIIDISSLLTDDAEQDDTAIRLHQACRDCGFFYVKNHGVSIELQQDLIEMSRTFFSQSLETKMQVAMHNSGRAWRGYFPGKEGLYFGTEIIDDHHPKVLNRVPLHGCNQFPCLDGNDQRFRHSILTYMTAMENLGRSILSGLARSLGLSKTFFDEHYLRDEPTCLFRIFNYPAWFCQQQGSEQLWGVGEHTEYVNNTLAR